MGIDEDIDINKYKKLLEKLNVRMGFNKLVVVSKKFALSNGRWKENKF